MYKQIYTRTVVQGEGRRMEPLPGVFDMLQYFETISPLVESLWSSQQDDAYIFYGWWRCWRPVSSPTIFAIFAAMLDFTEN